MGYFCFLLWTFLGGACGGMIYSLTAKDTHKLRLPFYTKNDRYVEIETGCLGHVFIGAFSGFLLVVILIYMVKFDITSAVQATAGPFSAPAPLGTDGLKEAMYALAISLIGGFLGLKLITKIADATLKEINSKIETLDDKLHEQQVEASAFGHTVLARSLINENDLDEAAREVAKAIEIQPTKFAFFVKALILKRQGDFKGAVDAIDRALALQPDKIARNDATVLWNKACYLARVDPVANLTQIINSLDISIKARPEYKNDIKTEEDLQSLIDNQTFKEHFGLT